MTFNQLKVTESIDLSSVQNLVQFVGIKGFIGTVKLADGKPLIRKVQLFEQESGALVSETMSNIEGIWCFNNLSNNYKYKILVSDYPNFNYQTKIAENLVPKRISPNHFSATGTSWSDAAANAVCTDAPVLNDTVTISTAGVFVQTKKVTDIVNGVPVWT